MHSLTTSTDPAGRFAFVKVPPGIVRLSLRDSRIARSVSVRPGEHYDVELGPPATAEGVTVSGTVLAFGQPVEGAGISIGRLGSAKTNADGSFAVSDIPLGEHRLMLLPPFSRSGPPAMRFATITVTEGMAPLELDASLLTLRGRVLAAPGSVAGARVRGLRHAESKVHGVLPAGPSTSDDDGRFEIAGLFLVKHCLVVEKEGFELLLQEWTPRATFPDEELDFILQPASGSARLHIRAVDDISGQSLDASVVLSRLFGDVAVPFAGGKTDADASAFVQEGLPAGRYRAQVAIHGPSAYRKEVLEFERWAGVDQEVEVRMRAGGSLEIAVATASGLIPESSLVELTSESGESIALLGGATQRSFHGRVVLAGLPVGRFEVRVTSPGYRGVTLEVEIARGAVVRRRVELE